MPVRNLIAALALMVAFASACASSSDDDECEGVDASVTYEPGFEPHTGVIEEWLEDTQPIKFDDLLGVTGTGIVLAWSNNTTDRIFLYADEDDDEIAGVMGKAVKNIRNASDLEYDYVTDVLEIGDVGVLRNLETGYYAAARFDEYIPGDESNPFDPEPPLVTLTWFFAGPSDDFSIFR